MHEFSRFGSKGRKRDITLIFIGLLGCWGVYVLAVAADIRRFPDIAFVNVVFYLSFIGFLLESQMLFREKYGKMILVTFALFAGVNIVTYLVFKSSIMVEKLVRSFEDKSYILQPLPDECVSDRNLPTVDQIFTNSKESHVYCLFGGAGTGKSFYLRRRAKDLANVLYFEIRAGQDIEAQLYDLLFDRDSNLALRAIDALYRLFAIKKLFPEKRTLEMIFTLLEENDSLIYGKLGNQMPLLILDNFQVIARSEETISLRIYDYIKHMKDKKHLNVVLASNEGGILNSIIEVNTFSRIDQFIKIPELHDEEIARFMTCCLNQASFSSSQLYRELIINKTTEYIGGNIHYLQQACSEVKRREGKQVVDTLNDMVNRRGRDFHYSGFFLPEMGFLPEIWNEKMFLSLIHTMLLLNDKGAMARQKIVSKVRNMIDIENFPGNIFRITFSSTFPPNPCYRNIEQRMEFIIDFQSRLHRLYSQKHLGKLRDTQRQNAVRKLQAYYNFSASL